MRRTFAFVLCFLAAVVAAHAWADSPITIRDAQVRLQSIRLDRRLLGDGGIGWDCEGRCAWARVTDDLREYGAATVASCAAAVAARCTSGHIAGVLTDAGVDGAQTPVAPASLRRTR